MNIQHRVYGSRLSPDSSSHCAIAKDLTGMYNAIYDNQDAHGPFLVAPEYNGNKLTYQKYKQVDKKSEISTSVTQFIKDKVSKLRDSSGYYMVAIGIASRYHLTHLLLDYTNPTSPKWYLFDDFGIGGTMYENENFDQLSSHSVTEEEVEAYYKKYLVTAINAYSRSKTLKNPTTAYGQNWPAYERPLYAELYFIVPKT